MTTAGFGQHDRYDNSFVEVEQGDIDHAIAASVYIQTPASSGSGTVIKQDNKGHLYILTCAHVIEGMDTAWIAHLGDLIETHVLFLDSKYDLALVKTKLGIANYEGTVMREFAEYKDIKAGDAVYSIGYPAGFGPFISQGIIAKENFYLPAPWAEDSLTATPSIAPGSSGGGMYVLEDGEFRFAGLNQWGWGALGNTYGFVPINEVMIVFEREGYNWLLENE